jgi:hypothetical protein
MPESEIWLGERATERNIKEMGEQGRLANYGIVHFATHGLVSRETRGLVSGALKGLVEPAAVADPSSRGKRDRRRVADRLGSPRAARQSQNRACGGSAAGYAKSRTAQITSFILPIGHIGEGGG